MNFWEQEQEKLKLWWEPDMGQSFIKNSRKMVKNRRMSTMQLILNRQHNGYWKENKTWKKKFWQKEKIVYERT